MVRCQHQKESVGRFPFFFLCSAIFFIGGCTQSEQNAGIVAQVNSSVLTMEMIHNRMDSSRTLSHSEIQQYANRWVVNELLFQEARQKGYDESEQVRQTMDEAVKQLSIAALLEKEVYQPAEGVLQQSEIASYFQDHNDEFTLKENLVRLSLAVFVTIEPAIQFRTVVLRDNDWNTRVEQYQMDSGKGLVSFSDSTFYSSSSLYPSELWKVASALGMLEVSFPVKTSVGYVVMRSLGQYKVGSNAPLAYVEEQIRNRLIMEERQKRYQRYLQNLRSRHTVQMMIAVEDSLPGDRIK